MTQNGTGEAKVIKCLGSNKIFCALHLTTFFSFDLN